MEKKRLGDEPAIKHWPILILSALAMASAVGDTGSLWVIPGMAGVALLALIQGP